MLLLGLDFCGCSEAFSLFSPSNHDGSNNDECQTGAALDEAVLLREQYDKFAYHSRRQ